MAIADFVIEEWRLRLSIAERPGREAIDNREIANLNRQIDNLNPQIANRKIGNRQSAIRNRLC
jgi:hypothetical protein